MIDKNTAPPAPTDAQPKVARPVGDEALIAEAIETFQRVNGYHKPVILEILEEFGSYLLALAHPTTGQETVATPRDGGVREAPEVQEFTVTGDDGYIIHFAGSQYFCFQHEVNAYQGWATSEIARLRAALSAPRSAGLGERENGLLATLPPSIVSDCENQALSLANLWTNGNEGARTCILAALLRVHAGYATPSPAQEPGTGDTGALADIAAERSRQIEAEGWTPEHDDLHAKGEMCDAAAAYASHAGRQFRPKETAPAIWPWQDWWWKPTDRRHDGRDPWPCGGRAMSRAQIVPRLMTKAEAAAYCGFSQGVFERQCEVAPMAFGDRRLQRYDRFELDNWIESRKTRARGGVKSMADAIAEF